MHRSSFIFGITYSLLYIAFRLFLVLSGNALSRFGYYYSHLTMVLLIVPFFYFAVRNARDKRSGGYITGRDALKAALSVFAVAAVITSLYNYFEFEYSGKELAIQYYNSQEFADYLTRMKVNEGEQAKIIDTQIAAAQSSSFRATTGKLFSFMIIGVCGAFITALLMRRKSPPVLQEQPHHLQ